MSILKSILHHYNKTTKSYDTLHPETESAQITDWNQGIVNTLASTALGGLVNTLTSDSLLAKMIQKVLTATGVKYSMGQNGYACFGSLVGGLIIQWVNTTITPKTNIVTFPLSGEFYYAGASNNGANISPAYSAWPVSPGVVKFTPSQWSTSGTNTIIAILICA